MVSRTVLVIIALGYMSGNASLETDAGTCIDEPRKTVIRWAFAATHDGWSSDEVLLQDQLNARFIAACREKCPKAKAIDLNWQLINLRKANQLSDFAVTQRRTHRHDGYRHAAEIAARLLTNKHQVSTDRMLCDPELRAEFDRTAGELAPGVDAYRLRKAAFGLRKSRQLRPELVVRVANWGRQIQSAPISELRQTPARIPALPGIYVFRDQQGYLYVGEAANLRKRLSAHLASSDRVALADYLTRHVGVGPVIVEMHVFPADSPAAQSRMRRAYESDLIASRKPKFNVRP